MNSVCNMQEVKSSMFLENEPQHGEETHYVWKIENFSMCPQRKGESLRSPEFFVNSMDESKFRLRLYPRGRNSTETENVACFLECVTEADYYITATISFLTSTGSAVFGNTKEDFCLRQGSKTCLMTVPDREDILGKRTLILPFDVLTISCVIKPIYRAIYCCHDDFSALSNSMTNLFNSKIHSDLTLCASGHRFNVHKFILGTRAIGLARHIGLLDNHLIDEAFIDTISVPVLHPLLNYLYTGKLEDLPPIVMNELFQVAKTFEMDDLRRDIFPLETRTIARTSIKVHWKLVWWNIEDFKNRSVDGNWPIHTFFDLNMGKFVIALSMAKDSSNRSLELNIQSKSILVSEDCIFLKCKVFMFKGQDGQNAEFCSGEYWFEQKGSTSNLEFTMTGNAGIIASWETHRQYPDELQLAFEFSISYPQRNVQSQAEHITNTLTTTIPALRRSYRRLCTDLDLIWKDSCLESDYNEADFLLNFSDVKIKVKNGIIRSHNAILAARSTTFSDMIARGTVKNKEYLDVADISKETLLDLLRYVYSGKMNGKTFDDLKALYIAAVKYKIPSLVNKCRRIIVTVIKFKNACEVLTLADEYEDDDMMKSVVDFIYSYQEEILESLEWLALIAKSPHLATKTLVMLSKKIV